MAVRIVLTMTISDLTEQQVRNLLVEPGRMASEVDALDIALCAHEGWPDMSIDATIELDETWEDL